MLRRATVTALASAAIALAACGGPAGDPERDFHAGFMDSCTGNGGAQSLCQCVYDKIVARYPVEEAMRRAQSGQLTRAEVVRLGQPCASGAASG